MIDIHCHLLYHVDDGAKTIEESVQMLKIAKEQGIKAMILTPHYRHGMFAYPKDKIEEHFEKLYPYAQKLGLEIFLGTEYHVNSEITEAFTSGRCHTLADKQYILTEYAYETEFSYIKRMTQEVILAGFIPVIAHAERYECMTEDVDRARILQSLGALIQNNADAVLGLEGRRSKNYCKKLLKKGYVDLIASDSHGSQKRVNHMGKCYEYITKKFGENEAKRLMEINPYRILSGSEE